jgi:Tfp pilus assembly protein PilF
MAVDKNKIIAEATRFVQKGALDKAIAAYQKILGEDPRDVRILLKVGELFQKKGDDRLAAEAFTKVAETYADQGFFLKSVAVYKQIVRLDPADVRVNERLAGLYQQLGLMSDAMAQLQVTAGAHERSGDVARLTDVLRRMVELDPENIPSAIKLGELHARAGQAAQALELFRRAADHLRKHNRADEYLKVAERIAGLEPGDLAEWIWIRSVPPRGAAVPGFSADPFYFRADEPLWRSVYTVVSPRGLGLELDAHHLPAPEVRAEGGREVARVARADVPALVPEPGAPGMAEYLPFVQVGGGAGREALARAMADGLLEPCRPSLEVRQLAAEIAASVPEAERGGDALPRAAYRRVQELILGQGGPFSEPAGAILSRGRGSRTVLLKSLLDALGVRARLALLRDFSRDPAPYRFPRPDLYQYAVLRVERAGRVAWLDPTTRGTPYGVLPGPVRGAEALVLPAPGEQLEVTRTPADDGSERRRTRLAVAVDAEGGAVVEGADTYAGFEAATLRASIEPLDAQSRRQAMEQVLAKSFRGATLLDLAVDGDGALDGPLTLRWRAKVERWARLEEGRAVAEQPIFPARLGARFVQRAVRETPLLVASDDRAAVELTVTLPPGWRPAPAPPASVATPFGSYRRDEADEAGRLLRKESFELLRRRVAPGEYPAFGDFARAVDAAQGEPLVFLRAGAAG